MIYYVFYYSYTESRNRTQATSVLVDRLAVNVHDKEYMEYGGWLGVCFVHKQNMYIR